MSTTYRITGRDAIRIAEREALTICCAANPIAEAGPVTAGVAVQIAKEDAGLIFIRVAPTGWRDSSGSHVDPDGRNVGDYFLGAEYLGPDEDGIEPCWSEAPSTDK